MLTGETRRKKITDMLAKESGIIIRFQAEVMQVIPLSMIMVNLHFIFPSGVFYQHTTSIIEMVLH